VTETNTALKELQQAIDATRGGRYFEALRIFVRVYKSGKEDAPAMDRTKYVEGLSFYGVALAMAEKKYKPAIEFCRKAVDLQFYNGEHFVNLARVYLVAGMRKKAIETLDSAIQSLPEDAALRRYRREIGVRSRPAIPFLSRDNPLNVAIGRARHKKKSS
jgi:tetratricopeptide (TPR) repeat protein